AKFVILPFITAFLSNLKEADSITALAIFFSPAEFDKSTVLTFVLPTSSEFMIVSEICFKSCAGKNLSVGNSVFRAADFDLTSITEKLAFGAADNSFNFDTFP